MKKDELKNREGYADPTPCEVLRSLGNDEKKKETFGFRPVVYICSQFKGDTEVNTANARRYCRFALSKNVIPFAPHLLYPQFMDDNNPEERNLALFMGQVMLDKCAEVWVFGTEVSVGMAMEIERAKAKEKKIRYFRAEVNV